MLGRNEKALGNFQYSFNFETHISISVFFNHSTKFGVNSQVTRWWRQYLVIKELLADGEIRRKFLQLQILYDFTTKILHAVKWSMFYNHKSVKQKINFHWTIIKNNQLYLKSHFCTNLFHTQAMHFWHNMCHFDILIIFHISRSTHKEL